MVELKGALSGIGLVAIAELISEVHHSGSLQLSKGSLQGTLAFEQGRLVAAECGEHHGLQALADCVLQLADGDFTFMGGAPSLAPTLDFGPAEFKALVERISSGEVQLLGNDTNGTNGTKGTRNATPLISEVICPLLGFADDPSHHYSRPTGLHRCYATGVPNLVSVQEQRNLCLPGQFGSCPRYRQAEQTEASGVPTTPLVNRPPERVPGPIAVPEVPRGVAARVPTAGQMRPSADPPASAEAREPAPVSPEPGEPPSATPRRKRGVILICGGALVGFILVGLLILVVLPALRPAPVAEPGGSTAPQQAAQPTRGVPPVVAPPQVAGAIATPAILSPTTLAPAPGVLTPPTPSAQQGPAAVTQTVGRTLMDVRFAGGPADNWVENSPFAAWSAGAYRFQAHNAARFVAVGIPINQVLSDVVVSATFRKTGGPPNGGYGLIVRDQGPEPRDGVNQQMTAYVLETGDLGEYGVWRRDGDHWVDLVPWTHSSSVRSGGSPNDLSVRAVGDQLTLTVNGADIATVQDSALDAGGVGLFVGGDYNEVALDHFSVQVPD